MVNLKKIIYLPALILLFAGFLSGCGDGDNDPSPGCSVNYTADLEDELTAITTAISVYSQNPTEANCNNYRQALVEYLNAMRPYGDCQALTGQTRANWQAAIDSYEESLDEIDCDDF